jgi:hypothetical protein
LPHHSQALLSFGERKFAGGDFQHLRVLCGEIYRRLGSRV